MFMFIIDLSGFGSNETVDWHQTVRNGENVFIMSPALLSIYWLTASFMSNSYRMISK